MQVKKQLSEIYIKEYKFNLNLVHSLPLAFGHENQTGQNKI